MTFNRGQVKNIIVFAPHADDEAIGCGGMISMACQAGITVTVVIMATGGVKHCHLDKITTTEKRVSELNTCSLRLGISHTKVLFPGKDMRLETLPSLDLVTALDRVLDEKKYDECYLPEPSHNIDHRITYESVMAALRPGARQLPCLVATYEGTTLGRWNKSIIGGRLYVDISSTFEKKIFALDSYQSQIRPYPHPTSLEAVSRLAAFRGMECGVDHAELFQIIHMVRT